MNEEGQGWRSSFILPPSSLLLAARQETCAPFLSARTATGRRSYMKKEEYRRAKLVVSTQSSNLEIGLLTTATRLHNGAQGCRVATTLGMLRRKCLRNPNGVAKDRDG